MLINPHQDTLDYCKNEKERAMQRAETVTGKDRYNVMQAVNAWDEIIGQLRKAKPIDSKRFQKCVATALRIVDLMASDFYKYETQRKINSLELKN
jgi:AICAR transformylase/IMP cyclohydrolase PurH